MSHFSALNHHYATRFHTLASSEENARASQKRDIEHLIKQVKVDYEFLFSRRDYPTPPLTENFMNALLEKSEYYDLSTFIQQLPGGIQWMKKSPLSKTLADLKNSFKEFLKHSSEARQIEVLCLSNLLIQAIPEEILLLPKLHCLEFHHCHRLRGAPFAGSWNILQLSFINCGFISFSKDLHFPYLQFLSLQQTPSLYIKESYKQLTFRNFLRCEKENLPSAQQVPSLTHLFIEKEALVLQQEAEELALELENREDLSFCWGEKAQQSEENSLGSCDSEDPLSYKYLN